MEKNSQNRTLGSTRARARAAEIQWARRYECVLGTNFLFDNLSLASKLSSVERETRNLFSTGVIAEHEGGTSGRRKM
jgi:hypothetical protein